MYYTRFLPYLNHFYLYNSNNYFGTSSRLEVKKRMMSDRQQITLIRNLKIPNIELQDYKRLRKMFRKLLGGKSRRRGHRAFETHLLPRLLFFRYLGHNGHKRKPKPTRNLQTEIKIFGPKSDSALDRRIRRRWGWTTRQGYPKDRLGPV